jgi:hypothetical protein
LKATGWYVILRPNKTHMKRFFLFNLALLLIVSSSGHVFAAFCPRGTGHKCCFAKTVSYTHSSSSCHANMDMHDMRMDDMNMHDMAMADTSMDHMAMNDMMAVAVTIDTSTPVLPRAFSDQAIANTLDQPIESCAHCVAHSGVANGPVSAVNVSGQSGKDVGFELLPVSRFLIRPPITLAQVGLPREHAPPDTNAPRHILISVFLI